MKATNRFSYYSFKMCYWLQKKLVEKYNRNLQMLNSIIMCSSVYHNDSNKRDSDTSLHLKALFKISSESWF